MIADILSLNVEDNVLRLVVARRGRVRQWASASLEPGVVRDGVVQDPQLFCHHLEALTDSLRVTEALRSRRLRLSVPGRNVLLRRFEFVQPPSTSLREAVAGACDEVLPVPQNHLHLDWRVMRRQSKRTVEIYCAGTYRNALDPNLRALKELRVVPATVEPKAFALARAVGTPTALVLDIEPSGLELVVVKDGLPDLIRTTGTRSGEMTDEQVSEAALAEVERVAAFYSSSQVAEALAPSTPFYLTGSGASSPGLRQRIEDSLPYPLCPLPPLLRSSAHFPVAEYAVNVGLSLGMPNILSRIRRGRRRHLLINLLPREYLPDRRRRNRALATGGALAALALLYFVFQLNGETSSRLTERRAELSMAENQLRLKMTHIRRGEELQQTIDDTEQALDFLAEQTRIIRSNSGQFADVARFLYQDGLPGVTPLQISDDGDRALVRGNADSFQQVLEYVDALRQGTQFSYVELDSMTNASAQDSTAVIQFNISAGR